MDHSTELFLAAVGKLTDEQFAEATALPGWSRAHIVAHVHFNAEALLRLLHWARTGERTPMYEGPEQRASEIEDGAAPPPPELRRLLHDSAERLADRPGRTAPGGVEQRGGHRAGPHRPAHEIVWMRTREVAVHAVDLDAGTRFSGPSRRSQHRPGRRRRPEALHERRGRRARRLAHRTHGRGTAARPLALTEAPAEDNES